jgi:autotransporter translocation and assembly factor TamB
MLLNGNRLFIQPGSITFANPNQFDPVFDLAAETRPHVAGEVYDITVRASGPIHQMSLTFNSDPFLTQTDVVSLLFGGRPDVGTAEQRALGSPQASQQQLMQTIGASLLASPISSAIGSVVERVLPISTVQITPLLQNETSLQNPSARITLGQRISPRVYLTYSRTLDATQADIILLEYEQNDRVSWVLSRNEDRTFALDFRIRYSF